MTMKISENYKNFKNLIGDYQLQILKELAQIPAPSHFEDKRVEYIKNFLSNLGIECIVDEAKNVIVELNCENCNEITIFAAHTDVVFPDTDFLPLTEDDEKIYAPGICDDTANVSALLMLLKYVKENNLKTKKGLVIAFDSCEEGLGNLKGSKALYQKYKGRIKEFISFDGTLGYLCNDAVGSHRYEVSVKTKGGHSFGNFPSDNAIEILARVISDLYLIQVPSTGKTTYNVGTIEGGTSVNTIAQEAKMLYEYRSDNVIGLNYMQDKFENVINKYKALGFSVDFTVVGKRQCSENVDMKKQEDLTNKMKTIGEKITGLSYVVNASSTDCNAFLSEGVNAVCLGLCEGKGAHTREEFLIKSSLPIGMELLGYIADDYFINF